MGLVINIQKQIVISSPVHNNASWTVDSIFVVDGVEVIQLSRGDKGLQKMLAGTYNASVSYVISELMESHAEASKAAAGHE